MKPRVPVERIFLWTAGIVLFVDVVLVSADVGSAWRAALPGVAIALLIVGVVRARRRQRRLLEEEAKRQEHEPGMPYDLRDLPDAPPSDSEDAPER
jgi:hypothetical protein